MVFHGFSFHCVVRDSNARSRVVNSHHSSVAYDQAQQFEFESEQAEGYDATAPRFFLPVYKSRRQTTFGQPSTLPHR